MELKKVKLQDLKYCPYNPRKISPEDFVKLRRSIQEFGYISPILINKRTGWIVGGNQRLKVLNELYPPVFEVEVIEIDMDAGKEKALNLALNKIGGEWDYNELGKILQDMDTQYVDFSGFDSLDIQAVTDITAQEDLFEENDVLDVKHNYPLVFLFTDEQERDSVAKYFKGKGGLDINKLKKLIKNGKSTAG